MHNMVAAMHVYNNNHIKTIVYIFVNIEVHVMCAMNKYATKELNSTHNMDDD